MRIILVLAMAIWAGAALAQEQVPQSRAEIAMSFRPVVQETSPAIVNIYARKIVAARSPFAGDPFFGQFFGQATRPRLQNSLGSGVLLSPDGLLVTNEHVIGNADQIRVVLSDRREFDADVLLSDPETDISVLQLRNAQDLPYLSFGDSDATFVGDLVLAIGNPFGVGQTVTSGIVSGVARSGGASLERSYLIQTDAAINPGNSGGALVNMAGELIGVNTSILTRSGGSNGIGFAVPSNLVAEVVEQAKNGARALVRPWSGLRLQPVDFDMATALNMDAPMGGLVAQIHPESPFAKAGIQVGDVLVELDGAPVNSEAELEYRLLVAGTESVVVSYLRGGIRSELDVVPGPAPDSPPSKPVRITQNSPLRGLEVSGINPAVIDLLDLPLESQGVVVLSSDNYARRFGFRAGDVILGINGEDVRDAADILRLARLNTRFWTIDLVRGGQRTQLRFRI